MYSLISIVFIQHGEIVHVQDVCGVFFPVHFPALSNSSFSEDGANDWSEFLTVGSNWVSV